MIHHLGPTPCPAETVTIPVEGIVLHGELAVPDQATGLVLFAHGARSNRFSPRNAYVAARLNEEGFATLLFDLLTPAERADPAHDFDFDMPLLARRLDAATDWLEKRPETRDLVIGYFGSSTGAAVALRAASRRTDVAAIVSRGGRPDLATKKLSSVTAPVLLIVGGKDQVVEALNREAQEHMTCASELALVPGAGHLFEEIGSIEGVADLAAKWFLDHMAEPSERRANEQ